MPRKLPAGRPYAGRNPALTILNTSLDRQADQVLRAMCPPGMTLGAFITALVFDYRARQEERARSGQSYQ